VTDEELKAIEALAEKCAPGPWEFTPTMDEKVIARGGEWLADVDAPDVQSNIQTGMLPDVAHLLVAARTELPRLVAEVRRLRGLIKDAEHRGYVGHELSGCPWCDRAQPKPHRRDCPAFTETGGVR